MEHIGETGLTRTIPYVVSITAGFIKRSPRIMATPTPHRTIPRHLRAERRDGFDLGTGSLWRDPAISFTYLMRWRGYANTNELNITSVSARIIISLGGRLSANCPLLAYTDCVAMAVGVEIVGSSSVVLAEIVPGAATP